MPNKSSSCSRAVSAVLSAACSASSGGFVEKYLRIFLARRLRWQRHQVDQAVDRVKAMIDGRAVRVSRPDRHQAPLDSRASWVIH